MFQDGASLVTHSQILSTFQDGGRVKFPTPGIIVDVKIPTHVRFTKSNSPGLPDPPILGQTTDRCINSEFRIPGLSSRDKLKAFESAKHYLKLHSRWSQVNCVSGLIKEGNETKHKTVYKPTTIQTTTMIVTQQRVHVLRCLYKWSVLKDPFVGRIYRGSFVVTRVSSLFTSSYTKLGTCTARRFFLIRKNN